MGRIPSQDPAHLRPPRMPSNLLPLSDQFNQRLDRLKRDNPLPDGLAWYPYDTLGVFEILDAMLSEDRRDLVALAAGSPVLDIACGDGALSFFLESLGCQIVAVENPSTNLNHARGFQTLRAALNSSAELELQDIDDRLDLGTRVFGLAFCLGVLYHLKNPFRVLETLARHARYCVLSTRIAELTVRGTAIANEPVAYLVGPSETNGDATNYWIFSEAGLRRILDRAGWEVCDYRTTGVTRSSDPARSDRDQRAFCMLRSKVAAPWLEMELGDGWYDLEAGAWRWTARVFSLTLRRAGPEPRVHFRFILPEVAFAAAGPIRLSAFANGVALAPVEYSATGPHDYIQPVPATALSADRVSLRFELDKAWPSPDGRELGVLVAFWDLDGLAPRSLSPITVGSSADAR